MSNTYTWVIESLDCYPQSEGQQDVVFNANWRLNGISSETKTVKIDEQTSYVIYYKGSVYGSQPLTYVAGSPYTPYANLTNAEVIGWVQEALGENGIANIKLTIDAQIENQTNPPVIQPPLPWVPAATLPEPIV